MRWVGVALVCVACSGGSPAGPGPTETTATAAPTPAGTARGALGGYCLQDGGCTAGLICDDAINRCTRPRALASTQPGCPPATAGEGTAGWWCASRDAPRGDVTAFCARDKDSCDEGRGKYNKSLGTLAYQYCEWQARAVCFRYVDRRREEPLFSCHPSFSGCDQRRAQELRVQKDNITEITKCDPID